MNKKVLFSIILALAATAITFTSCVKGEFDEPPIFIPKVDFSANTTIAELKALYANRLDTITDSIIIKGVVVANDESGNLYKKIVIQDETAGIEILLNRTNLYTEFKLGQMVYVKCQGMYMGDYGGLIQIGYVFDGSIGQLPDILIDQHLFRDSLPGAVPEAVTINLSSTGNAAYYSKLVKLENVHFSQAGSPWVGENETNTNRTLVDANGKEIIVRTSSYANFAALLLPKGYGTVQGILGVYNGTLQLVVRDTSDVIDFSTAGIYLDESFTTGQPSDWITFSKASNKNWAWSSQYTCMAVNGYGGDVASDDWLITPELDLTNAVNDTLTFRTWTKYTDSGLTNPLEVLISTNYSGTGDPSLATWTNLNASLPAANSATWTTTTVDMAAYKAKVRIAWHYRCSSSSTASSWEVDEVRLKGKAK